MSNGLIALAVLVVVTTAQVALAQIAPNATFAGNGFGAVSFVGASQLRS